MPVARGRVDDPARELGRIGVRLSLGIVMNVMEFGHARVARLQHLDVCLRCDCRERVGIDAVEERVHRGAPRPERVAVGACAARATGDRALERVRVQIRHARNQRSVDALGSLGRCAGLHGNDHAARIDVDPHVASPSVRRQRVLGEQTHRHSMRTASATPLASSGRIASGASRPPPAAARRRACDGARGGSAERHRSRTRARRLQRKRAGNPRHRRSCSDERR